MRKRRCAAACGVDEPFSFVAHHLLQRHEATEDEPKPEWRQEAYGVCARFQVARGMRHEGALAMLPAWYADFRELLQP